MKPIRIYNPFTGRAARRDYRNPQAYAEGMIEHLQEAEEWIRMMHQEGGDRPAMCQLWTMEHHDGRIARLPDQCPMERLRRESRQRQERWLKLRLMTINFKTNNNQKDETEI